MHRTTRRFWKCFDDLPEVVQRTAKKNNESIGERADKYARTGNIRPPTTARARLFGKWVGVVEGGFISRGTSGVVGVLKRFLTCALRKASLQPENHQWLNNMPLF